MKTSTNPEEALEWIIGFIESREIPYLICGGLAAIAYGSQRPLHDIDLYVPEENYQEVIEFGRDYNSRGPVRSADDHWNIDYIQLIYRGQKIEIGSSKDIEIFDHGNNRWHRIVVDFDQHTETVVLGKSLRVINKQDLIDYKSKLNRDVDKIDIQQITAN